MEVRRISPEEARSRLESADGYAYLDVRTTEEFEAGHVPGAKNIPLLELGPAGMEPNPRFVEVVKANFPPNAKLILGCQKGGRSLRAAGLLLQAGFTEVVDMRGGFTGETDASGRLTYPGWKARGFPTTTESAPGDCYDHLAKR
jgi:rhodanese-related sulfurtransferase